MILHLSGKIKRKLTSYFVSPDSKSSHEKRESDVERETQDDSDETEVQVQNTTCLMHLAEVLTGFCLQQPMCSLLFKAISVRKKRLIINKNLNLACCQF